jgi:murein tripeptide amidase MpaA
MKGLTIALDGSVGNNPMMMVDGGVHAREWISHMTVAYLIYQLVERSAENLDLLENVDWVIVPVVNPDGYVYSHEVDRFWRKNRVPQPDDCVGVDLNRNFGHMWLATNQVNIEKIILQLYS